MFFSRIYSTKFLPFKVSRSIRSNLCQDFTLQEDKRSYRESQYSPIIQA